MIGELDWQIASMVAEREECAALVKAVFEHAVAQKVLDAMSKPQRKKIKDWAKYAEELKKLPGFDKDEDNCGDEVGISVGEC